jgi:hypothetical protein
MLNKENIYLMLSEFAKMIHIINSLKNCAIHGTIEIDSKVKSYKCAKVSRHEVAILNA